MVDTKLVFFGLLVVALVSAGPSPIDDHEAKNIFELMGAKPTQPPQRTPPRLAVSSVFKRENMEDIKEKMMEKAEQAKGAAGMLGGMAKSQAENMKDQVTQMG